MKPGERLASGRYRPIPGDTPERAMADAIREAGLAPAIARVKAARVSREVVPTPQRLGCKVCGRVWYREPRRGRPPTTCEVCR